MTYIITCTHSQGNKRKHTGRAGIFFDRDGTIVEEKHYLKTPGDVKLLPEVTIGLRRLAATQMPLYLFTNQAGIAHGYFDENTLRQIHHQLLSLLRRSGIMLRGIYYCPHHPNAENELYRKDCFCRKPNPGLLYQAASHDGLDLSQSYVVGDKLIDVLAGKKVGAKTLLTLTGYGTSESAQITPPSNPDAIVPNLTQAAEWILHDIRSQKEIRHRPLSG